MRSTFAILRVVFGAAIAVAAFSQLAHTLAVRSAQGIDAPWFYVQNFFSFFTVDSNLLSAAVLLIGAVALARSPQEGRRLTLLRLASTSYMTVTLIVYNLLLRGIQLPEGETLWWSNEILHVVGPAFVVVDWLFAPGRNRLGFRDIWLVVIFPVVWAAYTLIRGVLVVDVQTGQPWYPYPFLNPGISPNGYLSVAFYVLLITGIFLAVAAAAVWVSRRGPAVEAAAD